MDTFKSVNEIVAAGISEFALRSFDGCTLVIVGSFDLCYYHDVELVFDAVESINCRTYFRDPIFREAGRCEDGTRFSIESDGEYLEIVAASVQITIAKVVYQKAPQ